MLKIVMSNIPAISFILLSVSAKFARTLDRIDINFNVNGLGIIKSALEGIHNWETVTEINNYGFVKPKKIVLPE